MDFAIEMNVTEFPANDVLLYARSSKKTRLEKGEYARVKSVDAAANQITVVRADGSDGEL